MRYRLLFSTLVTLSVAGLYGCGDDVTDPEAFLESAEAEAIMLSAEQLPLLPGLMEDVATGSDRDRAVLLRARELWAAGSVDDDRAASRRRLAVRYALPVLSESLSEEEWGAVGDGLEEWLITAETLLQRLALPEVEARLTAARRYLTWSAGPTSSEQRRHYYLLLGMSELVETTPRFVAVRLVRDARAAVARAAAGTGEGGEDESSSPELSERALERAERLKDWADQAVVEGEYLLAIQRAYYAIQLVEGS